MWGIATNAEPRLACMEGTGSDGKVEPDLEKVPVGWKPLAALSICSRLRTVVAVPQPGAPLIARNTQGTISPCQQPSHERLSDSGEALRNGSPSASYGRFSHLGSERVLAMPLDSCFALSSLPAGNASRLFERSSSHPQQILGFSAVPRPPTGSSELEDTGIQLSSMSLGPALDRHLESAPWRMPSYPLVAEWPGPPSSLALNPIAHGLQGRLTRYPAVASSVDDRSLAGHPLSGCRRPLTVLGGRSARQRRMAAQRRQAPAVPQSLSEGEVTSSVLLHIRC
jgi:hypothetical protein